MLKSSHFQKNDKTYKKLIFWSNLHKKGSLRATLKLNNNFLEAKITKADQELSETFYFIKISYVLPVFVKKCNFQLKYS